MTKPQRLSSTTTTSAQSFAAVFLVWMTGVGLGLNAQGAALVATAARRATPTAPELFFKLQHSHSFALCRSSPSMFYACAKDCVFFRFLTLGLLLAVHGKVQSLYIVDRKTAATLCKRKGARCLSTRVSRFCGEFQTHTLISMCAHGQARYTAAWS